MAINTKDPVELLQRLMAAMEELEVRREEGREMFMGLESVRTHPKDCRHSSSAECASAQSAAALAAIERAGAISKRERKNKLPQ